MNINQVQHSFRKKPNLQKIRWTSVEVDTRQGTQIKRTDLFSPGLDLRSMCLTITNSPLPYKLWLFTEPYLQQTRTANSMMRQSRVRAETTIRGMIHSIRLDDDTGSRVTVEMLFLSAWWSKETRASIINGKSLFLYKCLKNVNHAYSTHIIFLCKVYYKYQLAFITYITIIHIQSLFIKQNFFIQFVFHLFF